MINVGLRALAAGRRALARLDREMWIAELRLAIYDVERRMRARERGEA